MTFMAITFSAVSGICFFGGIVVLMGGQERH